MWCSRLVPSQDCGFGIFDGRPEHLGSDKGGVCGYPAAPMFQTSPHPMYNCDPTVPQVVAQIRGVLPSAVRG